MSIWTVMTYEILDDDAYALLEMLKLYKQLINQVICVSVLVHPRIMVEDEQDTLEYSSMTE